MKVKSMDDDCDDETLKVVSRLPIDRYLRSSLYTVVFAHQHMMIGRASPDRHEMESL